MSEDDELLTTKEVARRYAIHPRTVPLWVDEGRIPRPLEGWPGRDKRWLKSEIVEAIRSLRKREAKAEVV